MAAKKSRSKTARKAAAKKAPKVAKKKGKRASKPKRVPEAPSNVVNIMDALRRSIGSA